MSICIVVDGYSAGRQFPKVLAQRGFTKNLHIQSTPHVIEALTKFEESDYMANIQYYGDTKELINQIKHTVGSDEILCVIAGSEPGVELADLLSENLGLENSNGTKLSHARRNKFAMREAVKLAGLNVPNYLKSADLSHILNWVDTQQTYPIVIKPLNSAGTDNVFICKNPSEIEHAFYSIMNNANIMGIKNSEVLVESYLVGTEYVVNSVSCYGKHKVNDIWVYRKKYLEGYGNIYDREELLDFEGKVQAQLVSYTHKVLDALDIKFGPSHAEIMLTDSGPVLVEVGARVGGATNSQVSKECVGHDAINLTIDSYLDQQAFFAELERPNKIINYAMVVDLATEQEGIVEAELFTEALKSLTSLKSMLLKVKPGEYLHKTKDLATSPIKIHLMHKDKAQLEQDYNFIQKVAKTGFILKPLLKGNSKETASLWKKEYEQQGIPSSYRNEPSSVVSKFFYPYYKTRSPQKFIKKVVDMGCGLGRNSIFFAEKGFDVTALDIVADNIEQIQQYAEEHNLKITAICGDVTEKIPAEDNSVDIIIDIFCYKHQLNDNKREFYRKELCRILKDNGYYLLSLAGKDDGYYGPLLQENNNQIIDPHTNIGSVLFDPEDIKKEFAGYKIKKIQTTRKNGLMHGKEYERVTHAFIMKKDSSFNQLVFEDNSSNVCNSSKKLNL